MSVDFAPDYYLSERVLSYNKMASPLHCERGYYAFAWSPMLPWLRTMLAALPMLA